MPLTARRWTSSEKRAVGARQEWRCGHCAQLLPGTFEIDHDTPLHEGGADDLEHNAIALCNVCHSKKTLRERIAMETKRTEAILRAKAAAIEEATQTARPLAGKRPLLDPIQGPDVLENRFLRFAYVRS